MPATFEFIRALDDLSEEDARLAGLDGLSLREMNRDSRPISDGYVITTSAFDVFARSAELQATVTWFAERARTTALDEQARYSRMIEVVVRSAIVPEDLRDAILTNYWELRKKSVCVTVLGLAMLLFGLIGEEELLAAVKKCWASVYQPASLLALTSSTPR